MFPVISKYCALLQMILNELQSHTSLQYISQRALQRKYKRQAKDNDGIIGTLSFRYKKNLHLLWIYFSEQLEHNYFSSDGFGVVKGREFFYRLSDTKLFKKDRAS
jgi:hypothetical protein